MPPRTTRSHFSAGYVCASTPTASSHVHDRPARTSIRLPPVSARDCRSRPSVRAAVQCAGAMLQGIAYYLDTIVGGDGLLYQPSEKGNAMSKIDNAASGARDRASRAAVTSVSTCVCAPSCVLVPYKTAFELRRVLTVWVNNFGAFAAALVVGSCGSIITSTDPHIAAATDSWYVARGCAPCPTLVRTVTVGSLRSILPHVVPLCRFEQTTPSQLAVLQLLWAHHVSSGKDDVIVSNVWLDTFIRHDDQVWLDYQSAFRCVSPCQ